MHARIENGLVAEYPIINLRQRLPEASLPADLSNDAALPDGFVFIHPSTPPQINVATQRIAAAPPVFDGSRWVHGYEVVTLSEGEAQELANGKAADVRVARNALLSACDWTQAKDIPDAISAPWATYRQALRDVPDQAGFPWTVEWPAQPA